MTLSKWAEKAESFARKFKLQFRYLPSIERRLRELVESGDVRKNGGSIPTYEMVS